MNQAISNFIYDIQSGSETLADAVNELAEAEGLEPNLQFLVDLLVAEIAHFEAHPDDLHIIIPQLALLSDDDPENDWAALVAIDDLLDAHEEGNLDFLGTPFENLGTVDKSTVFQILEFLRDPQRDRLGVLIQEGRISLDELVRLDWPTVTGNLNDILNDPNTLRKIGVLLDADALQLFEEGSVGTFRFTHLLQFSAEEINAAMPGNIPSGATLTVAISDGRLITVLHFSSGREEMRMSDGYFRLLDADQQLGDFLEDSPLWGLVRTLDERISVENQSEVTALAGELETLGYPATEVAHLPDEHFEFLVQGLLDGSLALPRKISIPLFQVLEALLEVTPDE